MKARIFVRFIRVQSRVNSPNSLSLTALGQPTLEQEVVLVCRFDLPLFLFTASFRAFWNENGFGVNAGGSTRESEQRDRLPVGRHCRKLRMTPELKSKIFFQESSSSICRVTTKVPHHPFNHRMSAAIVIRVVSRYGKVTLLYWMKPLTAPPGGKRWS
ncbi:hypothetical protein AVEN_189153-1 [Araneus ventricosus]|uniref:DUF4817 domain-containing protein n=1 Tax=Araneus ventricosus TaxID=182803 RepID=A0A4Y2NKL8_ARAVE|nr:hypothetical protein AVEN_189153-1 [Araneus ventricosus]